MKEVPNRLDDGWQGGDWRHRAIKLAATMVRHDDRISPNIHRGKCIFDIQNAFDDQFPAPVFADRGNIIPWQWWVELADRPIGKRRHILDTFYMADNIAELPPFRAKHAKTPSRLLHEIQNIAKCWFWRRT